MKMIKTVIAVVCAMGLLAGTTAFAGEGQCPAGKKQSCCDKAKKDSKSCDKCDKKPCDKK